MTVTAINGILSQQLPIAVVGGVGTTRTLSSILSDAFGPNYGGYSNFTIVYFSAGYLQEQNSSYWNPANPSVNQYFLNGVDIGASSTGDFHRVTLTAAQLANVTVVLGNNILHTLYVTVAVNAAGSPDEYVRYGINVVAPSLLSPTAGNGAPTPADIVASAQRYAAAYNGVFNPNDCHGIAANVAAAAGATLDYDVTNNYQNPAQNQSAGFWRIAYRGSDPNPVADWQSLLQPGDIVRVGWTNGGKHTFTVISVSNLSITVLDNNNSQLQISIHQAFYGPLVIPSSVTIYRLSPDHLYLINGSNSGQTLAGSTYNDLISPGQGDDAVDGGPGTDIVVFAGNRSAYTITDLGNGSIRVAGPDGTDTLTRVERLQFDDQTIHALNHAPTVSLPSGSNVTAAASQSIAASRLFSGSDVDGDTLTYYLYDSNAAANSGRFMVNGSAVPAQTIYQLTAAQFAQATFVAGASGVADDILVQTFDGRGYSGWNASVKVSVAVNHAPTVSRPAGANVSATASQSIAVSSLFSGSDSDGNALTYYLYDSNSAANSGRFMVNGSAVPAQTIYQLTAAQFAQATFVAGASGVADDILVQAFDGQAYSGWNAGVKVTVPVNRAPTVSLPAGANVSATASQSFAVSSLFRGNDSDGDALTYYVYDSNMAANSGRFMINGSAVPAQTIYQLTAAQFAQATFVAGADGVADDILVQAFDGKAYSGWNAGVHIAVPVNHAPTVSTPSGANVTATPSQAIQLASLFSGSDVDGNSLTYYLYDSNAAANSGHFVVGGNVVPAQTITQITAAQLAQATFVAGAAGITDNVLVQAFDSKVYSGWNANVNVNVPANHAPTVSLPSGSSVPATAGQSLQLSNLFSGNDVDGNALSYFVYDYNSAANSGHFVVGGNVVPAQTITAMTAAQLAQATFVAGAAGTADDIFVQAFDGQLYSGWNAGVHLFV